MVARGEKIILLSLLEGKWTNPLYCCFYKRLKPNNKAQKTT